MEWTEIIISIPREKLEIDIIEDAKTGIFGIVGARKAKILARLATLPDFIAMPGHKGLLGPQGTGLLLCKAGAEPLLYGGTGSFSRQQVF